MSEQIYSALQNPVYYLLTLGLVYIFFGLDDLIVDLIAIFSRIKPRKLSAFELEKMLHKPEKNIAIIIPAWDESDIIFRMLCGNVPKIKYRNFHIFVGTYPNDEKTIEEVKKVEQLHPNVHCVVNIKNGPTSKGQILNHLINEIERYARKQNIDFYAYHMQDAEDIIHPYALKLVNDALDQNDFVQIPVFSLKTEGAQFVAGTYMDEFAEKHTKDAIVRSQIKAGVPSAGVGTTFSTNAVKKYRTTFETVFNENSLTEDYELGLRANKLFIKAQFCCAQFHNGTFWEFIATREYFPSEFRRSIRQKTRWTTGIALQGWENLSWFGGIRGIFFLYRDRKGIFANTALLLGYILIPFIAYFTFIKFEAVQHTLQNNNIKNIFYFLVALMINRAFWRMFSTYKVYGFKSVIFSLFRIPLSNVINAFACINAVKNYVGSKVFNTKLKWSKTSHKLPEGFGQEVVEDING